MSAIQAGLDKLRRRRCPKHLPYGAWSIIVGDALRLLEDGWVGKALSLGWSAKDLYGIPRGDDRGFTSLVVWLDCRRVTMMDADGAQAGPWCQGFMGPGPARYRRGSIQDAAMLWDAKRDGGSR